MISSLSMSEVVPARYDLSLSEDGLSINISFCSGLSYVLYDWFAPNKPYLQNLMKSGQEMNLPKFICPKKNENWGFGSVLESMQTPTLEVWSKLSVKLPVFKTPKQDWEWKAGFATAMSLQSLFYVINPMFEELPAVVGTPQLIVVEGMISQLGMHGSSIAIAISEQVRNWILNQKDDSWTKILVESMKKAYCHMWQEKKSTKYQISQFRVSVDEKGYLYFVVPGDCCCMGDCDKRDDIG